MDVMFYEAFDEEERLLRRMLPSFIDAGFTDKTVQMSLDRDPPARLVSIRTQSIVPNAWSGKITGVLTRSEGFDHLGDLRRRLKTSARMGHLSGYCSRAVAEQAVMLLFALTRKLPRQVSQTEIFHRDGLTGCEIRGKNALVVGVGRIGREIVGLARGIGMNVKGVDIIRKEKRLEYVPLREGIAWADVVFCSLPLTPRTRGLLDKALPAAVRRKPFVINVGRGEVLSFKALAALLKEKKLSGVALDVYPDEAMLADGLRLLIDDLPCVQQLREILSFDNVICTPHNAFNTEEALEEKCRQSIEAVRMFLSKGRFPHEVKK